MIVTYQPVLVLLSIAVAIMGSLTALALTSLSRDEDSGRRSFVLANGGLIMGATIWSMHFVAMMAVEIPTIVNYNLAETIGSICVAILATGTGLALATRRGVGFLSIPFGGVLMGLGIAGMHYLGMGAIRGCGLAYDLRLVGASVAIAILASMAALWFAFFRRNLLLSLVGGVVQGLAIASMHYTAMAATYFVPLEVEVEIARPIFTQDLLAYLIVGGMAVISAGNLALLALMRRNGISREQIRLVQVTFRKLEPFAPLVADLFYRRLFDIAPQVRHLFPDDLTGQGAKLMAMLAIAIANLDNVDVLTRAVRDLGRRHFEYGVGADHYEPVGHALMWTLEQGLREDFTPAVQSAWREAYTTLTGMMLAGAAEAQSASRGVWAPVFGPRAA